MKKIILLILCICNLNTEASAVVLFLAQADDSKKAEEIWLSKDSANRVFLEKRRSELKKKHALKKAKLESVVAEKVVLSDSSLKTESLLTVSPIATEGDTRAQESKEIDTH